MTGKQGFTITHAQGMSCAMYRDPGIRHNTGKLLKSVTRDRLLGNECDTCFLAAVGRWIVLTDALSSPNICHCYVVTFSEVTHTYNHYYVVL